MLWARGQTRRGKRCGCSSSPGSHSGRRGDPADRAARPHLPLDAAQASVGQVMRGAATLGCHRAGHPHLPWRGPVGRQSMIRNARLQPPVWLWEPNAGVSFWAMRGGKLCQLILDFGEWFVNRWKTSIPGGSAALSFSIRPSIARKVSEAEGEYSGGYSPNASLLRCAVEAFSRAAKWKNNVRAFWDTFATGFSIRARSTSRTHRGSVIHHESAVITLSLANQSVRFM